MSGITYIPVRRHAGTLLIGAIAMFLAGPVPSAFAQSLEEQITNALQPPPATGGPFGGTRRGMAAEEQSFINSLRSRPARGLTAGERVRLAEIAKEKPSVDVNIEFDYNSDVVGPRAVSPLLALGRALSKEQFRGAVFLINGHTDAKGSAEYNQNLSERRAESVKRVLSKEFGLRPDTLIAVGYGKSRLKNQADPWAGENRRVQVVNMQAR